jgi:hypothetical protein
MLEMQLNKEIHVGGIYQERWKALETYDGPEQRNVWGNKAWRATVNPRLRSKHLACEDAEVSFSMSNSGSA